MKIISGLVPGALKLAKLNLNLSREARRRLEWFEYYAAHGQNARLTCRHFDISPQTFYRWKRRYDPMHPQTLESHSCRPRHVRQPTCNAELVPVVLGIQEAYPRWGKDMFGRQGIESYDRTYTALTHTPLHLLWAGSRHGSSFGFENRR